MRSDGTRRLLEGSSVMMKLVNPESIFKCDFALVNHYQISLFLSHQLLVRCRITARRSNKESIRIICNLLEGKQRDKNINTCSLKDVYSSC